MKVRMNADQEKMETSHDKVTIKVGEEKMEVMITDDNSYPVHPE
jgi:phosphoribosyl-ATP pyrophosphohydrolase